jgi:predicted enzyme related to lactoylglutathione lyase
MAAFCDPEGNELGLLCPFHLPPSSALGPGGGITLAKRGLGYAAGVYFYVQVDRIDETYRKALQMGAKKILPVTQVPPKVEIAMFEDPTGHVVGLIEAPGAPFEEGAR